MTTVPIDRDQPSRTRSAQQQNHPRLPQIQGLRALAIVLVMAYHAGLPIGGGFVGVDVFFVISGYVIARLLLNGRRDRGRFDFADFYKRRVRRLLPALAVVVTVVLLLSMAIESPIEAQTNTAISGAGASIWLGNAALYYVTSGYFAPNSEHALLLHTWSLSVEEQFYVVFPWVIALGYWLAVRFGRSRTRTSLVPTTLLVTTAFLASFAINIWLCYGSSTLPAPQAIAFFFPFGRAWEFAAGALVALGFHQSRVLAPRMSGALAWVGLVVVLASALLINEDTLFPGYAVIGPVLGTALLIVGVQSADTTVSRLLSRQPLVTIGDLSYSLYLWHWPLIAFAVALWGTLVPVTVLAATLSIPVAWWSYHHVEQPFRLARPEHTPRLLAACVAVPVALALVLALGAAASWGNDRIRDAKRQVEPKALNAQYCQTQVLISDRDLSRCTFAGSSDDLPIILLGDSNAGQYADGLVRAAQDLDRTVTIAVAGGCSMNLVEVYVGSVSGKCLPLARDALSWLATQAPSIVLVASANEFVDNREFALGDPATGKRATSTLTKERAWTKGLEEVFRSIRESGHTPMQIRAIPHFGTGADAWTPAQCLFPELLWVYDRCGETKTLAKGDAQHAHGLAAEDEAARRTGTRQLDLRPLICPENHCSTRIRDFWVYREGMHVTAGMSRKLAPALKQAIQASR